VSAQLAAFLAELATSLEALDGTSTVAAANRARLARWAARLEAQRRAARAQEAGGAAGGGAAAAGAAPWPSGVTEACGERRATAGGAGGAAQLAAWIAGRRPAGGSGADLPGGGGGGGGGGAPDGLGRLGSGPLLRPSLFTHRPEWETARQVRVRGWR
jgi:hypothetical protein